MNGNAFIARGDLSVPIDGMDAKGGSLLSDTSGGVVLVSRLRFSLAIDDPARRLAGVRGGAG